MGVFGKRQGDGTGKRGVFSGKGEKKWPRTLSSSSHSALITQIISLNFSLQIIVKATRKLKEFNSVCKFGDRDAHDGFVECRPFRDQNYEVSRLELAVGTQAVAEVMERSIQTTW